MLSTSLGRAKEASSPLQPMKARDVSPGKVKRAAVLDEELHASYKDDSDAELSKGHKAEDGILSYISARVVVVLLLFGASFLAYMNRVNLSVAIIPMSQLYGWDGKVQGAVLSAFFYGYILSQMPGGWLADNYGGKVILTGAVLCWSISSLVIPSVSSNLYLLIVARMCNGLCQGVMFPSIHNLIGKWVPTQEKSRAVSLASSGSYLGTGIGMLACPQIIVNYHWEGVFYIFGLLGFIWFVFWQSHAGDSPATTPRVHPSEVAFIEANTPKGGGKPDIAWRKFFSHTGVWAILINNFCFSWGFYTILTWLPSLYHQLLNVDMKEMGIYSVIPWFFMFFMANVSGYVSDTMIKKGFSITTVRKLMQSIGFLAPAFLFTRISSVASPWEGMLLMSLLLGFSSFSVSGYNASPLDIAPRSAGFLVGISNTFGTLAAILGVTVAGQILATSGSWTTVFGVCAGIYVFGDIVWLLFATGERIFD